DQRGRGKALGRRAEDPRASPFVVGIADALAQRGVALDEHLMAVRYGFAHARRRHADAILVNLDLPRHADVHCPETPALTTRADGASPILGDGDEWGC